MVFEHQECQERCFENLLTKKSSLGRISWNPSGKYLEILGEKLELMEAPEASDIIWENMSHSQTKIFRNTALTWVIVIAFLHMIVLLYIVLHLPIIKINKRYPPLRACGPLEEVHNDQDDFYNFAFDDMNNTLNSMGRGYY